MHLEHHIELQLVMLEDARYIQFIKMNRDMRVTSVSTCSLQRQPNNRQMRFKRSTQIT